MGHGGRVFQEARSLGAALDEVLDMSASINPLGMPKSATAALLEALDTLGHYPDTECDGLRRAVSSAEGLLGEDLVFGNGSTELIHLITNAVAPKSALLTAPAFSEYENALYRYGLISGRMPDVRYLTLKRENSFDIIPEDFVREMKKLPKDGPRLAFLCNPNNPTGRAVAGAGVLQIAREAEKEGIVLLVDEAFVDYAPRSAVAGHTREVHSLVVLRSMTKYYALTGLRLGYAVLPRKVPWAGRIHKLKEPWSVNTLAQKAGEAAVRDAEFKKASLDYMEKAMREFSSSLDSLKVEHLQSRANYFLLRHNRAAEIADCLRAKGILLRQCGNFRGLDETYLRAAVRTEEENGRFFDSLGKVLR